MPRKKKTETETKKAPTTKKTTKKTELTRKERAMAYQQRINSKYKTEVIRTADEFNNVFLLRRPFGIPSLDLAIAGGVPAGGLTELIGAGSVGKDYLVNRLIVNLQNTYGDDTMVNLCMSEMHYDKRYAKICGVRVALNAQEIAEWEEALGRKFTDDEQAWALDQVGTFHETMAPNAEQLLDITAENVNSNIYQLVVINSIGALLTKAEEEAPGGLEDKHYGGAASVITGFCHKLHTFLNQKDELGNDNLTSVVGVNQYRDNLGRDAKYNPMKAAGGNAWKHAQLLSIGLRAGTKLKAIIKGQQFTVGKEINWEIRKQKAGGHDGPKGMYPFYFGEHGYPFGAEVYQDLIIVGVQFGIIQQAGSWLSYEDGDVQIRAQGKENFAQEIASAGQYQNIKDKVMKAADVKYIVKGLNE